MAVVIIRKRKESENGNEDMKAWRVDNDDEWCVLIFAPTRSRAKVIFWKKSPASNYDYSFIDIRALRHKALDGMTDNEKLFDSPDDLPEGVEFWITDEEEGETWQ